MSERGEFVDGLHGSCQLDLRRGTGSGATCVRRMEGFHVGGDGRSVSRLSCLR